MFYIPNIDDYFEILTDEEVKCFVSINFCKSIREKKNLGKVAKSLYIFLATQSNSSDNCIYRYNVEILNIFDLELQLINTKPAIKNE